MINEESENLQWKDLGYYNKTKMFEKFLITASKLNKESRMILTLSIRFFPTKLLTAYISF